MIMDMLNGHIPMDIGIAQTVAEAGKFYMMGL